MRIYNLHRYRFCHHSGMVSTEIDREIDRGIEREREKERENAVLYRNHKLDLP